MSIKVGDKDLFPYLGDYRPINIYKGEHKVAGWKWTEQSGKELLFENTYNDFVEVEVDGKSYQGGEPSPENPIEINNLNDFDLVSSVGGRNLLKNSKERTLAPRNSNHNNEMLVYPTVDGQTYTISADVEITDGVISLISVLVNHGNTGPSNYSVPIENGKITRTYVAHSTTVNNMVLLYAGLAGGTRGNGVIFRNIKIEKGNKATDWTPAPEDISGNDNHPLIDKINLSLSEPLRSVGDVKDRLFRDSDGLWKVERNVGERVLKGTTGWSTDGLRYQGYNYAYFRPANFKTNGVVRSNILPYGSLTDNTRETLGRTSVIVFNLRDSRSGVSSSDSGSQRANKIRDYLFSIEGAMVSYELATPTTETLDQNLQDKLNSIRSFQDSNYVYTMVENLKPTLHARLKVKDI